MDFYADIKKESLLRQRRFGLCSGIFRLEYILLRHPEAHFSLVGGGEELDAGAVEGGAEPGLRVEPQIHAQPLLMAFVVHVLHLHARMPQMAAAQPERNGQFVEISQRALENMGK